MMAYVYGALAAVMLVMGLTTWWALSARDEALASLAAYEASAATVIAERLAAQEETRVSNERKAKEIVDGYNTKIAAYKMRLAATAAERDTVSGRLRDALKSAPASAEVPTPAAAAGPPEGAAGRDRLLEELAGCVRNTEQLDSILKWYWSTH